MSKKSPEKFEDKIKKLENLVNELESGEIAVEESIEKYTEAMKIAKECDDILKNIETKIAKIVTENNELEDLENKED